MLGKVWSMPILYEAGVAVFPALSVAIPVTDWFAPSAENCCADGQVATPDRLSLQANVTDTGDVNHPLGLTDGCVEMAMVGGVRSKLIFGQAEDESPAVSIAWPHTD